MIVVPADAPGEGSQFEEMGCASNVAGKRCGADVNCHDNAVAESFFQLLKRERIRRRIYADREEARRDVFDYIEMFYNPKRCHSYVDGLSPVQFEQQYFKRLGCVY